MWRTLLNLTFDDIYINGKDTVAVGEKNVQNMMNWLYTIFIRQLFEPSTPNGEI